jgi:hypothetical protein
MLGLLKSLFTKKSTPQISFEDFEALLEKKVSDLEILLFAIAKDKATEALDLHKAGKLTPEMHSKALFFKDIVLAQTEKEALLMQEYNPIEERFIKLKEIECYEEIVLIGTLFISGNRNTKDLYQKGTLFINDRSFANILYIYCFALLMTDNKVLCQPYVELLEKILIANPRITEPTKDSISRLRSLAHYVS